MSTRVERPDVRSGYDAWAPSYDATANPLVALDRRYTMARLGPQPGERILDAGGRASISTRSYAPAAARSASTAPAACSPSHDDGSVRCRSFRPI